VWPSNHFGPHWGKWAILVQSAHLWISQPDFQNQSINNTTLVRFSYLLRLCIFCEAPRGLWKFPQKCQKIAGCWGRAIYVHNFRSLRHQAHPLWNDRVWDTTTSQPWSDATCPCTTSWSTYFRFVTLFLLKKARQSTSSGVVYRGTLRQTMVDSYCCLDRVVPERMSQVSRQSEVVYINGAPSTPGYLLALLRELLQCPRALTEITKPKQVRKMNLTRFLYHFKKSVGKSILTFRT